MKDILKKYLLYFLVLVYVSGSIGFALSPEFFGPFTPYTLLLTCLVFLYYQPLENKKIIYAFFIIAILGFLIEVLGVKTRLIFGAYNYGNGLGFKIFNVPLIISLNWAILISASIITISRFLTNKHLVLGCSAILITGIDFIIEQVAFKLDFWKFEEGLAGLHNYVGWTIVGYVLPYFFYSDLVKGNKTIALAILLLQMLFFTTNYIFL